MTVVIVVVISSIIFVWSVSSFSGYQAGSGFFFSPNGLAGPEAHAIENVFFYQSGGSYYVKIYVRNTGTDPLTVDSIYINATHYNIIPQTISVKQTVILVGANGLLLNAPYGSGSLQKVTIATIRGTVTVATWVA